MYLRIRHATTYRYTQPVQFGPHRLMLRPRDSFDLRVVDTALTITPQADLRWLHDHITKHTQLTGSAIGASMLADWPRRCLAFTKVMPTDYKRVLDAARMAEAEGRDVDSAIMEAARG